MSSIKKVIKYYPQDYVLKYTLIPLMPKFISPNQITTLRFILTPFVLLILLTQNYAVGIPLFLFTAFTDMLDGSLARIRDQITSWGITFDPIADKLLIGSVTLVFIIKFLSIFLGLAIIGIELVLIIVGAVFRRNKKTTLPSSIWGKIKMALQVLGVLFLLIGAASANQNFINISFWIIILSLVFACISTFLYLKEYLKH